MVKRSINWLFRSFTPYVVGMLLGMGFFILLLRFMDAPGGLLQSAPGLSDDMEWLAKFLKPLDHSEPELALPHPEEKVATEEIRFTSLDEKEVPIVQGREFAPATDAPSAVTTTQSLPSREETTEVTPSPTMISAVSNPSTPSPKPPTPRESRKEPANKQRNLKGTNAAVSPMNIRIETCGAPPTRPGPEHERYLACLWRRNCQIRLDNYQKMIYQGLKSCPEHTIHAQTCRNFYRSLQLQNPPQICDQTWLGR
ncbi:MAG: hypothetical protein HQL84_04645 [Magnetococcales bacterium]|nr:hypothetical protein [Magnetococcales bacterium]MBF0149317.1 hypothetical protein [Magnetococcales bacterium]MBF0174576.1 hypothetical protein [Magnetococcales bacterium]MBF0632957.1 hypothetical protein [Magnetococcales bacterium]